MRSQDFPVVFYYYFFRTFKPDFYFFREVSMVFYIRIKRVGVVSRYHGNGKVIRNVATMLAVSFLLATFPRFLIRSLTDGVWFARLWEKLKTILSPKLESLSYEVIKIFILGKLNKFLSRTCNFHQLDFFTFLILLVPKIDVLSYKFL